MTTFEFNGKSFYIDNGLKEQLDTKIIPDLKKKDMDVVFIIEGAERSGKSRFAQIIGAYVSTQLGSKFDISNVCMTPTEFKNKTLTAEKRECIIDDEAHRGMASARAMSEVNTILKDLMMEMGQRNLFVLIVLPTFFLLDKYAALFRSRGMFHIYLNKGKRGYWVFYNQKNKLKLYLKGKKEFNYHSIKYPMFRGRFLDQFPIPEAEYNAKKAASFGELDKNKSKEELSKLEQKQMEQRNILLKELWTIKDKPLIKEFRKYLLERNVNMSERNLMDVIRPSEDAQGT